MKIRKSSVVTHIGKLCIQIPDLMLYLGPKPKDEFENLDVDPNFGVGPRDEILDLPDDYFMRCSDDHLTVGRESGFLFLSPKGYAALKPMLREVFTNLEQLPGPTPFRPRGTWEEFERAVEKFFATVRQNTRKRVDTFRRKAAAVDVACIAVFDSYDNDPADGYA